MNKLNAAVENYDDAVKLNPTFHAAKKRLHELEKRGIFPNSKIQSNIFFLYMMISRYFSALHTNWWLKIKLVVVLYFLSFEKVTFCTNSCRVGIQMNQALIKASNSRQIHKDEGKNRVAKDVSVDSFKVLVWGKNEEHDLHVYIRTMFRMCMLSAK